MQGLGAAGGVVMAARSFGDIVKISAKWKSTLILDGGSIGDATALALADAYLESGGGVVRAVVSFEVTSDQSALSMRCRSKICGVEDGSASLAVARASVSIISCSSASSWSSSALSATCSVAAAPDELNMYLSRSEERRVGKECPV